MAGVRWVDHHRGPPLNWTYVLDWSHKNLSRVSDATICLQPHCHRWRAWRTAAKGWSGPREKMVVVDVTGGSCVAPSEGGDHMFRLKTGLHGTRDAVAVRQCEIEKTPEEVGFKLSATTQRIHFNNGTRVRVVLHVDDFLCNGSEQGFEFRFISAAHWLTQVCQREGDRTHLFDCAIENVTGAPSTMCNRHRHTFISLRSPFHTFS